MKALSDHKVVLLDIGDTLVHITEPFEIYTKRALKRCFPYFNTDLSEDKFVRKALAIRNELRVNAHKSLNEESIYFFFNLLEKEIGNIICTAEELERTYISSELEITQVFDESLEFLNKLEERGHLIIAATNNFSPLPPVHRPTVPELRRFWLSS